MDRRTLLRRAIHGMGALFTAVLGIPAISYLLDPRNRSSPAVTFRRVAALADLKVDEPKQVAIRSVRRDAWTLHGDDVIGRVWLIRRADDRVEAFTTICPHLGCSINFDSAATRFVCPCHNGTFHLSGERIADSELGHSNPAPRGMDQLETKIEQGAVLVQYENFFQGLHDKVRKS